MDNDITDLSKIRIKNVQQYLDILSSSIGKPLNECTVLDVGCSVGAFSFALAPYIKQIFGVDINENDISKAKNRIEKTGIKNIRFKAGSIFDISEEGALFINTLNKWFPIEAHKKLPFLGYLPKKWGNKYSKLFGRGEYLDYYLRGYSDFISLLNIFPINYEFKPITTKLLYRIGEKMISISPIFWRFSPAFQVIVKKQVIQRR